jgi:hypothetical protein
MHGPPYLRTEAPADSSWLQIRLRGVTSNRAGVGARVRVVAGTLDQIAEVHSGRAYQSHYGTMLHFGLGGREQVDRIEVRWPHGAVETFSGRGIGTRRPITLTQGTGDRPDGT